MGKKKSTKKSSKGKTIKFSLYLITPEAYAAYAAGNEEPFGNQADAKDQERIRGEVNTDQQEQDETARMSQESLGEWALDTIFETLEKVIPEYGHSELARITMDIGRAMFVDENTFRFSQEHPDSQPETEANTATAEDTTNNPPEHLEKATPVDSSPNVDLNAIRDAAIAAKPTTDNVKAYVVVGPTEAVSHVIMYI